MATKDFLLDNLERLVNRFANNRKHGNVHDGKMAAEEIHDPYKSLTALHSGVFRIERTGVLFIVTNSVGV
jgi:hypothetical protein